MIRVTGLSYDCVTRLYHSCCVCVTAVGMQQGHHFPQPGEGGGEGGGRRQGITTLEGTIVFPPLLPPSILDSPPTVPPDPCLLMNCEFGSSCVILDDGLPRCSCPLNCSDKAEDEPVCASDLKMYQSECSMSREACQRQVELRLRPLELCEGNHIHSAIIRIFAIY